MPTEPDEITDDSSSPPLSTTKPLMTVLDWARNRPHPSSLQNKKTPTGFMEIFSKQPAIR